MHDTGARPVSIGLLWTDLIICALPSRHYRRPQLHLARDVPRARHAKAPGSCGLSQTASTARLLGQEAVMPPVSDTLWAQSQLITVLYALLPKIWTQLLSLGLERKPDCFGRFPESCTELCMN